MLLVNPRTFFAEPFQAGANPGRSGQLGNGFSQDWPGNSSLTPMRFTAARVLNGFGGNLKSAPPYRSLTVAARNRRVVFTAPYRAATVRERYGALNFPQNR